MSSHAEFQLPITILTYDVYPLLQILEKGFQKKTIVAFTNSTVFILDFNI